MASLGEARSIRIDFRYSELTVLSLVYAVPIPIAITQPVVWIVRPEAQARLDQSRGRKHLRVGQDC